MTGLDSVFHSHFPTQREQLKVEFDEFVFSPLGIF